MPERRTPAMPDVQHIDGLVLYGEEDAIGVGLLSVKQLPHLEWESRVLGSERTAFWKLGEGCDRALQGRNQCQPVSPAYSESNHERISSASWSAVAVISTWKVMLTAQLGEEFGCRSRASGSNVFVALVDAHGGLGKVLAFPL
jgi:hypothetical protein